MTTQPVDLVSALILKHLLPCLCQRRLSILFGYGEKNLFHPQKFFTFPPNKLTTYVYQKVKSELIE